MRPKSWSPFGTAEGSESLRRASGTTAERLDVAPGAPSAARQLRLRRRRTGATLAVAAAFLALPSAASAAAVGLGTAGSFSTLGGSTVTNTGPTTMPGDLGVTPGTAITGFPPGVFGGTLHANDAAAQQAQSDVGIAYDDAASRPSTSTVAGDLAGQTLPPGVYSSASTMGLTGDLVLNAGGDPDAVFVFQVGTALTVGSGSRVLLTGGAQACNVVWQVGTSATIGSSSAFAGNVLALSSVTMVSSASLDGRALARTGAVTLDSNVFVNSACTTPGSPQPPVGGTATETAATSGTTGGTTSGGTAGTGGTATGGGTTSGPTDGSPTTTPKGTTSAATTVGSTGLRLEATVRPGSGRVRYYFQLGTTKRYGRTSPSTTVPSGGTRRVRRTVRGLRANTTYHYRIVIVAADGTRTYGRDRTTRTARSPARLARASGGFAG